MKNPPQEVLPYLHKFFQRDCRSRLKLDNKLCLAVLSTFHNIKIGKMDSEGSITIRFYLSPRKTFRLYIYDSNGEGEFDNDCLGGNEKNSFARLVRKATYLSEVLGHLPQHMYNRC